MTADHVWDPDLFVLGGLRQMSVEGGAVMVNVSPFMVSEQEESGQRPST